MVKYGSTQRCVICEKLVGFAEAVYHDGKVYHQNHYRCTNCNKKLSRGAGLTFEGALFCHNCHSKAVGPKVFKKKVANVVKKRETLRRVKAPRQPRFAHTSVNLKQESAVVMKNPYKKEEKQAKEKKLVLDAGKRLHEFEVAIFDGKTVGELRDYLALGDVDTSAWSEATLEALLDQITAAQCELGYDENGKALRVVSVAKLFIRDGGNNLLLLNPLNSLETGKADPSAAAKPDSSLGALEENVYPGVLDFMDFAFSLSVSSNVFAENTYDNVFEFLGFNAGSSGRNSVKISGKQPTEIPAAIIPETTFTLSETPQQAAARLFGGRFGKGNVSPRMFSKQVHEETKTHLSEHFKGLNSEYHVFNVMLKSQLIKALQKTLPVGSATSIRNEAMKAVTGMNTNWYLWCDEKKDPIAQVVQLLKPKNAGVTEKAFQESHFPETTKTEFRVAQKW